MWLMVGRPGFTENHQAKTDGKTEAEPIRALQMLWLSSGVEQMQQDYIEGTALGGLFSYATGRIANWLKYRAEQRGVK